MTPNEDSPLHPDSLLNSDSPSDPDAVSQEVEQLLRLVRTGEEGNIELSFLLSEGLGNPPAFKMYIQSLIPLCELAFENTPDQLNAQALLQLFQLTELSILKKGLIALPKNIGELLNLQELHCVYNQLQSLPESVGQLHNLQTLICYSNKIKALPESVGTLQSLHYFDCGSNYLQALPQSIEQLLNLEYL